MRVRLRARLLDSPTKEACRVRILGEGAMACGILGSPGVEDERVVDSNSRRLLTSDGQARVGPSLAYRRSLPRTVWPAQLRAAPRAARPNALRPRRTGRRGAGVSRRHVPRR